VSVSGSFAKRESNLLRVRRLGRQPYAPVFEAMRRFSDARTPATADELWLLEHPPVFTQGQAGRAEHVLAPGDIPVLATDRGGQVTYHGPGQLVGYVLVDCRRRGLGARALVTAIEQGLIDALAGWEITGSARPDAPGVYVGGAKIASLGLRIRRGRSYHGFALNVDVDLEPFSRIDPCGMAGLPVTRLVDLGGPGDFDAVCEAIVAALGGRLGYTESVTAATLPAA